MEIININKEEIPVRMFMIFEEVLCELRFKYNFSFDFFTVDLLINNEEIILGEKLVYGKPLFTLKETFMQTTVIIPFDVSDTESRITYENFGVTVFLFVFDVEIET